jgi:hypothetical protein
MYSSSLWYSYSNFVPDDCFTVKLFFESFEGEVMRKVFQAMAGEGGGLPAVWSTEQRIL